MKNSLILLTLFLVSYYTHAQYTLQDADVVVKNGIILNRFFSLPTESTHIIIPEELDGQKVIGLGPSIFYMNDQIEKVTFPESLIFIQSGAFTDGALKELIFPSNLRFIGDFSFDGLDITDIIIPKSVKYIGASAFQSCDIQSAIFEEPSNIRLIGNGAFHNNFNLQIVLPDNNAGDFIEYYDSKGRKYQSKDIINENSFWDNAYYSNILERPMDTNDLILTNDTIVFGDYFKQTIIPDSINDMAITTIGREAFLRHSIEELSLPYGVTAILE